MYARIAASKNNAGSQVMGPGRFVVSAETPQIPKNDTMNEDTMRMKTRKTASPRTRGVSGLIRDALCSGSGWGWGWG